MIACTCAAATQELQTHMLCPTRIANRQRQRALKTMQAAVGPGNGRIFNCSEVSNTDTWTGSVAAKCPALASLPKAMALYEINNGTKLDNNRLCVRNAVGLPRTNADGTVIPGLADVVRGHPCLTDRTVYAQQAQFVAVDYTSDDGATTQVAYGQVRMRHSFVPAHGKIEGGTRG